MSEGTAPEDGAVTTATQDPAEGEAGHEDVGATAPVSDGSGKSQDHASPDQENSKYKKNGFATVIGNTTLLGAVLIYMGWNYENSLLSYFQFTAFSLNIGTVEYALKGLTPLFDSDVVFFAALMVAVLALASKASAARALVPKATALRKLVPKAVADRVGQLKKPADRVLLAGLLVTAVVLPLIWLNTSGGSIVGWLGANRDRAYFVLALLAASQLLSAWPVRRSGIGPFTYPLALIVAAMCTLWAAGLYTDSLGSQGARAIAAGLPRQTAVTVYSVTSLGLDGQGVTCQRVLGATGYPYVCTGLRLLLYTQGTYYLLPVRWTPQDGRTIILDDSNQVRVELSPGS